MKIKNGFNFQNRITFYDDFATGQEIFFFFQFEHGKPDVCEGIIVGEIVGFENYALDVAVIKVDDAILRIKVKHLNHTI